MTNPFEDLMNQVDQETPVGATIDENKDAVDGVGGAGFTIEEETNTPIEVTQGEIQAMLEELDTKSTEILWENTENYRLVKLLAKAPNAARWATEVMGLSTLTCEKGMEEYIGKSLPINMPQRPTQPIDGYWIEKGDGSQPLYLAKADAIEWLINNTVGRIVGGDEGKELHVVESNSKNLSTKKLPVKLVHYGLSAHKPEDVEDTFEPDFEADGTPKTTKRQVALDPGKPLVGADNKKITLRGTIEDFPVFKRKEKFIDGLGVLNQRTLSRGRVASEKDKKTVLASYAELLVKYRKAQTVGK